ncbi:MAG: ISNCY family transposase [Candidatus Zixiibacteriota bacterium]
MAEKNIIRMSIREVKRLKVIQEAIERQITQRVAASLIGLSERQTRRLVRAVREEGERGVIHRLRGRFSNRKTPTEVRAKVLMLYRSRYIGFGPTLASEKLGEVDGIKLSDETMRKWLMEAGLWQRRRKRSRHRQWRQRKECFGEMVQMDGSHHDWLEGIRLRRTELVLMAYIDDATNNVFTRFYDYEGTIPAMDSFKRYVRKYGLPLSIYLDRHTTYKSTKKLTEWEEFEKIEPLSQFERAVNELGVKVIHAYSPQAKGRIERLFGILQDRLIKEMRLRGIKTKESANEFLKEYLPKFNRRFRVCPANETDVHVRVPKYFNLDKYLCIKTERTVRNDNTITHNGKLYQIEKVVKTKKVIVEERLNGSLHIMGKGVSLKYREIAEKPVKIEQATDLRRFHRPPKPAENHPWRRSLNWNAVAKKEDTCILIK